MPYPNEHAARIRQPGNFNPDTFRRTKGGKAVLPGSGLITVPNTISIIWGKLKGSDKPADQPLVQALRFPTKNYTASEAKSWLSNNKVKYISFEPAKPSAMKTILIYSGIYSFVAEKFIQQLNEIPKDEDVIVRLNSPGGSVFAGWGMIAALKERTGKNILKVDGHAASMGFMLSLYFDEVHALDVTKFMVHRASGYVENEDDKKLLDSVNQDIRNKLEKRIKQDEFEKITGITIDELFNSEKRRDIWVSAKEAKKIGLVHQIDRLEPEEMKAISQTLVAFSTFSEDQDSNGIEYDNDENMHGRIEENDNKNKINVEQKIQIMTKDELKTQHPDVYNAIFNEGKEAGKEDGIKAERTRVKSYLAYLNIDNERVVKAIKEGDEFTSDVMAELNVKASSMQTLNDLEKDNTKNVKQETPKPKDEDEEKSKVLVNEIVKNVTL